MSERHWRLWVSVLVGWTLVGVSFTLNYYLFSDHYVAIFRQPPTLREMLVWELPYWLLWAALSPLILRLVRRFPFERGRLVKSSLVHPQLEITQAQLQALKMQLQPHFLFNTLNSISTLLDEDVEAADEMLARLGDFLRLTLENTGAQEVTLQEELEFLRCYLEIERVRFQDRLTVELTIEPDTLDARVPNLILQPIVENAIRHGVVARAGDRKSTRLNSSHDQISYAVFCLKK